MQKRLLQGREGWRNRGKNQDSLPIADEAWRELEAKPEQLRRQAAEEKAANVEPVNF